MTDMKSNKNRRKLLKSIAAGGGAVIAGKSLPENWAKPVVDSVLLPVHGQTSPVAPASPLSCTSTGAPFAYHTAPGPDVDTSAGDVLLPWLVAVTPPPTAPNDTFSIDIWLDGVFQSNSGPITLAADGTYSDTGFAGQGLVGVGEFRYLWQTEVCSLFWNFVNTGGNSGPAALSATS